MTPKCPICGAKSDLADAETHPQTKEQYLSGTDNYTCQNGHTFEAKIPFVNYKGYAIRGDM